MFKPAPLTMTIDLVCRWDRTITLALNRTLRWPGVQIFFSAVSSLGNGRFWYLLMLLLSLRYGVYGLAASLQMGLTALITLAVYRSVKGLTQRPRPGAVQAAICQGVAALDEYSFPSGHTMHAISFSIVAVAWFPLLLTPLAIFCLLTALSRIILGLHYPTDVLLGALFGFVISLISLALHHS